MLMLMLMPMPLVVLVILADFSLGSVEGHVAHAAHARALLDLLFGPFMMAIALPSLLLLFLRHLPRRRWCAHHGARVTHLYPSFAISPQDAARGFLQRLPPTRERSRAPQRRKVDRDGAHAGPGAVPARHPPRRPVVGANDRQRVRRLLRDVPQACKGVGALVVALAAEDSDDFVVHAGVGRERDGRLRDPDPHVAIRPGERVRCALVLPRARERGRPALGREVEGDCGELRTSRPTLECPP